LPAAWGFNMQKNVGVGWEGKERKKGEEDEGRRK
jgi:hypothetical protein